MSIPTASSVAMAQAADRSDPDVPPGSRRRPCTGHPYYCTNTAVRVFEQQIRFLRQDGYRAVSLADAYGYVRDASPGERLVAITFDDGYADFYTNALPILHRYGYSATVFLPTAYIGNVSRQFKGADCLTWSQVRELRKAG